MSRSVLFLGGTGTISWWCVRAAQKAGWQVTVVGRGTAKLRSEHDAVRFIRADVRDSAGLAKALTGLEFDAVADFLTYDVERLEANVETLGERIGQYVFVSTASAYQKPLAALPITESTPLANPYWEYSRKKIACEDRLIKLVRERAYPATIVRPSHTYDAASQVTLGGWTDVARMRDGLPVVVHGDGTSPWTLTHAPDFAYCFQALLGDPRAIGDTFHITGDEALTWDAIYRELARAAGAPEPKLVHVASQTIARFAPDTFGTLVGDKAHAAVFDNSKVRRIATGFAQRISWAQGSRQIVDFHDSHPDWAARSPEWDALSEQLAAFAGSSL
ncbi:MAG: NAD-dependent epimerase/dehydratase family protein [Bifidobacteriaceae bacterium]|jgi:nucleoside-diphosphate-sugar epimerase|nr:NAD-dependent epimerase/dehydratase family protein [Bifidobacteriaceae bacterium]